MTLQDILKLAPVVPVLIIEEEAHAVPLAKALVAGGLYALEVTLRTPAALEAIRRIAGEVEGAVVGAGTITTASARQSVADAGAKFGVSPGLIEGEGFDGPVPLLPGIATATELMWGLRAGYTHFKLFPANIVGGVGALKAFASPFPQAMFCPTGGVSLENANDYLAQPNVICVGGSWVAPMDAVRAGDWGRITDLARAASQLGKAA
ncbi:MAG: bifunctional 4-hydroxy-2-oxoglutarate aldolase/2-dehydro-3-deoxy-phosphogluconate aldolase [Phenylobacterium sp.]|uniref:bifunctional 4-hydroxy-2-oxoglutarate aldolase/2-dehydro-3-deoxy-phosphogluconate aldolase n=1 Tax=Phenylobacterium sp. TaxID=1871053 RepID=UPI0027166EA9|nr:bifunctional 4-hydroxy-2-oxoglutarate aldolase/2-dehydro-3-deoxy-phosphogluconate aldolase [Phenylobacterium sp.]MDO8323719.1 bifunctional 4-hydroxy-2-oxoglutarate aldolase/2-dehydro-3-deoxy-phosphogluconate aldolase [Phenylobacterium sp.]MDP2012077.1 bifunctional 4-hydroxy-2-oxoglutarate aldolase/2-dehydro-3-deoxy-phosphogluconate aldolase [Phenylobacterium sp.]MDP3870907.1 bifunctional 4-hydroxy-2-oxoglutarate aldolase/2-dehydro-3-deoxy-phosphogluconate aldolase [Phenylobacterium sp.]